MRNDPTQTVLDLLLDDAHGPDRDALARVAAKTAQAQLTRGPTFEARAHMDHFRVAVAEGRVRDALAHGEAATSLDPTRASHHYFFGAWLGQAGRADDGVWHCRRAAALDPAWDRPHVEIAAILWNAGRHEEALAQAEGALPALAHPTDFSWRTLAFLRRRAGKPREGLEAVEESLALNPTSRFALHEGFFCAEDLGNAKRAKDFERRLRTLGVAHLDRKGSPRP